MNSTLPPSTPRRATVVTLSALAGVAPSTVTRALKGDTRISQKMRDLRAVCTDLSSDRLKTRSIRSCCTKRRDKRRSSAFASSSFMPAAGLSRIPLRKR
ncbi:MAG: LacI family DNA-binding transcriptional regulator [Rhizobiaceae bacterium]|nr:MAG: LacI family DNA-binding transcriptional regulator [Rhizobiaceae bacterium]